MLFGSVVSISGLRALPGKTVFSRWITSVFVLAEIIFACGDLQSHGMAIRFFVLAGCRMSNTLLFGMIL